MKLFKNKYFVLGNMLLLIITIPIILFFLKKQTQTGTHAAATTQLTLTASGSATINTSVGTPFTVDVMIAPNQNIVSIVDMYILYDATKLTLAKTDVAPNTDAFPVTLRGPTVTAGSANVSLNIGSNVTKAIQAPTKVATLTFHPTANTASGPTQISFDATQTRVFSLSVADQPGENVLQSTTPASVTIGGSAITPTPTLATTTPPPATGSGTASGTPPICNSLVADRITSGTVPFSILLTGNGTGTNNIQKASFVFGDGAVSDVTSAGGIGTKQVNAQVAHTYNNAGTFNASVIFTDSANLVSSASASCKQTITVTAAVAQSGGSAGGGTTGGTTGGAVAPQPTIGATGNATGTLAIIGGIILTIVGGAALLLL